MKNFTTLKNIAEYVGVDPATVSRALDPVKRNLISPEVREKIEKAAVKLNYRARMSARSLATNKSFSIGVVLHNLENDLSSPFFSVFLTAFLIRLHFSGYSMQILPVTSRDTMEKEILNYLYSGRVDGFFIGQALSSDKILDEIERMQVPVVILDDADVINRKLPRLCVDDDTGAEEAVDALIAKGVSNAVYWHHDYMYFSPMRMAVFEKAWQNKTGKPIEKLVYKPLVRGILSDRNESYWSARDQIEALKKYEAVVCCTDLSAFAVMDAFSEKGVVPGKDVYIIGYDNIEENPTFPTDQPVLSTIDKKLKDSGVIVAEMLLEQIATSSFLCEKRKMQTKFIKRASMGD